MILFIGILINPSNSFTISTKSTTVQSIYEQAAAEIRQLPQNLMRDKEQLRIDREEFRKKSGTPLLIKTTDVFRLNVGGEIIMTTRDTLTRFPKSILSIMFNGRWEKKLQIDQNGNIFLDFNPILFRHLLDQLQISNTKNISPPFESSLVGPFKKMLRKLGLDQELSSDSNLITFNVGGHVITNRKITLNQLSNSTFDTIVSSSSNTKFDQNNNLFVDHDPTVFQQLINQLREQSSKNVCHVEIGTKKEKISFQRILTDVGVCST
jgi:hypothetical protein